jgi:transmembrane sensor
MIMDGGHMDRHISDQTAEEAGLWDTRLRSPDCTDADRALFAQWRDADSSHLAAFERLQTIVASLRNEMSRADVRALRDAALRARPRHQWRLSLLVAASLAALTMVIAVWTELPALMRLAPLRDLVAFAERITGGDSGEQYITAVGQRSTVTLRDGSSVELNAKTRIKVNFTETRRSVELVDGQALFHVAKNPYRPFIVRAGNRQIVAIGTAFDVRVDATCLRVTLIEGKVAVSTQSLLPASARSVASKLAWTAPAASAGPDLHRGSTQEAKVDPPAYSGAEGEVFLAPGQQLIAPLHLADDGSAFRNETAADPAVVRSVDVAKVIGWHDGRVFLEDLALSDAVTEMNRHSPVQIRVDSPELEVLRVNGMFRAGEQDAFAAALESYFPITVQRNGDTEIILTARRKRSH